MLSTDSCPEGAESMLETCTLAVPSRLSETMSRTEILNRFILRQGNAAYTEDLIAPSAGRPATKLGSNGMPTCKSIQKVSKGGEP